MGVVGKPAVIVKQVCDTRESIDCEFARQAFWRRHSDRFEWRDAVKLTNFAQVTCSWVG